MFSLSLGSVSTLFRWGGNFFSCIYKIFLSAYNSVKIIKIHQDFPELWSQMFCHLFCGSQCTYIRTYIHKYSFFCSLLNGRSSKHYLCNHLFVFTKFFSGIRAPVAPSSDGFHWKGLFFSEKYCKLRLNRPAPTCQISLWSIQRVAPSEQKDE